MNAIEKIKWFVDSLIVAILVLRVWLWFSPATNFNLFGYNVHHLFTGAFLLIIAIVFLVFELVNKYTLILLGVGAGFVIDELVYLVGTDGSDLAYFSTVSFLGMLILLLIILGLIGGIYYAKYKKKQ